MDSRDPNLPIANFFNNNVKIEVSFDKFNRIPLNVGSQYLLSFDGATAPRSVQDIKVTHCPLKGFELTFSLILSLLP